MCIYVCASVFKTRNGEFLATGKCQLVLTNDDKKYSYQFTGKEAASHWGSCRNIMAVHRLAGGTCEGAVQGHVNQLLHCEDKRKGLFDSKTLVSTNRRGNI